MDAQSPAKFVTVDTHQFWAFPPLDTLTVPEILEKICEFAQDMKMPNSGIPPTLVGEWSLSTGHTANSTTQSAQDQPKRTWFRELFEAQNAAYAPNAPYQSSIGWYFWSWKTEYDIDAWSYRKGVSQGYIPSNVSDPSTYAFPIMENGCIDYSHNYTAPATVADGVTTTASSTASATSGSKSGSGSGSSSSSTPKSLAPVVSATLGFMACMTFGAVLVFNNLV
jgi:glucan 1,3-beta-glucosidase